MPQLVSLPLRERPQPPTVRAEVSNQPTRGEGKTVTIVLDEDAFKYFDDVKNEWVMDKGAFDILVGAASDDIKLRSTIKL
jgi:hypothetical protein